MYKYGGDELAAELTRVFKELWDKGNIKGDRRLCDNHRGIPLLANAGNIFAKVIVNRFTTRLKSPFSESQCNFRSGRGTTDMLFAARHVLEKCREQNLDLYMVFVDLTKPFDPVSREGLWNP